MSDFDAILCSVVDCPEEDIPKLVLCDYCREVLNSDALADLAVTKLSLLSYKPYQGPMGVIRNPKQAAEDLRRRIRWLEEDLLEDGLDAEVKAIEEAFLIVAFLTRDNQRGNGWRDQMTRLRCRDMLRQTADVALPGEDPIVRGRRRSFVFTGPPVVTPDQLD